ncbi:MAG TPA: 50S ribosomal protein L35 [Candidatus Omnitrophota bacterium]|nr:50S ribosomal protein L35 [Candidatus Omnitrophota bacterium]HPS19773.1 50S ribosomal protein L35 [Candidatus Omnitrophota bacterium]
MPKMKTNKGVAKRFKMNKRGKVKRSHAGKRHILTKKNRKRKRNLRHAGFVDKTMQPALKKLLPYG